MCIHIYVYIYIYSVCELALTVWACARVPGVYICMYIVCTCSHCVCVCPCICVCVYVYVYMCVRQESETFKGSHQDLTLCCLETIEVDIARLEEVKRAMMKELVGEVHLSLTYTHTHHASQLLVCYIVYLCMYIYI